VGLLVSQLEETKTQLEATEKAYKSAHAELTESVERINELSNANSTLLGAKRKVETELQTVHVRTTATQRCLGKKLDHFCFHDNCRKCGYIFINFFAVKS